MAANHNTCPRTEACTDDGDNDDQRGRHWHPDNKRDYYYSYCVKDHDPAALLREHWRHELDPNITLLTSSFHVLSVDGTTGK